MSYVGKVQHTLPAVSVDHCMTCSIPGVVRAAMKMKQLEFSLQSIKLFASPKWELEQYPIGAHLASRMLFVAESNFGDITDKVVADIGCGGGTLGIAACLFDAAQVIGVDVDPEILYLARENCVELEVEMDLMISDVRQALPWRGSYVDTIVTFPPFGHHRKGADMVFLSKALQAAKTVYSLHKSSTRKHVKQGASDGDAMSAEILCELRYKLPIPYLLPEEQDEVTVAMDLWRFTSNWKS